MSFISGKGPLWVGGWRTVAMQRLRESAWIGVAFDSDLRRKARSSYCEMTVQDARDVVRLIDCMASEIPGNDIDETIASKDKLEKDLAAEKASATFHCKESQRKNDVIDSMKEEIEGLKKENSDARLLSAGLKIEADQANKNASKVGEEFDEYLKSLAESVGVNMATWDDDPHHGNKRVRWASLIAIANLRSSGRPAPDDVSRDVAIAGEIATRDMSQFRTESPRHTQIIPPNPMPHDMGPAGVTSVTVDSGDVVVEDIPDDGADIIAKTTNHPDAGK